MNKTLNISGAVFILAIVAALAFWAGRGSIDAPPPTIVTKVDTAWTEGPPQFIFLPSPTLVDSKPQPIPDEAKADTSCKGVRLQYNNLVRSYYTKNRYRDTLRFDSTRIVNDCVVYKNQLSSCTQTWLPKFPVVTVHTTETITQPPRFKMYVGGAVGMQITDTATLQYGPDLLFQNKRDNILRTSYRWLSNGQQAAEVGYAFKISFKRR